MIKVADAISRLRRLSYRRDSRGLFVKSYGKGRSVICLHHKRDGKHQRNDEGASQQVTQVLTWQSGHPIFLSVAQDCDNGVYWSCGINHFD